MKLLIHIAETVGLLLVIGSIFLRKSDAPRLSLNPKLWTPIWRQESHYRGPGFVLMFFGLQLFALAFVADLTMQLCK